MGNMLLIGCYTPEKENGYLAGRLESDRAGTSAVTAEDKWLILKPNLSVSN